MKKVIFYSILVIAVLVVARGLTPTKYATDFNVEQFAELPVQVGGRIKPLDSVARNTLLILSARQKVVTREGQTLSPILWFMDLTMRPNLADTYPVFKIEFPDDLGFAGLAQPGERYYSFNDLRPHFEALRDAYANINPEPRQRSAYEKQIVDLNDGLGLYHRIMHSLHPVGSPDRLDRLTDEYQSYLSLANGQGMAELRKQQAGEDYNSELLDSFLFYADDYLKLSRTAHMAVVPPPAPIDPMEDWKNIGLELLDVMKGDALSPYVTGYAALTMAYRANDAERFNQDVETLRQRFIADFPSDIGRVHFEQVFNDMQPFYVSMQLYVLIFLVVCISWLRWPEELGNAAYWMLIAAFIIHTFGLFARMYIQGRPPVTNLYSSAVFVGWGRGAARRIHREIL